MNDLTSIKLLKKDGKTYLYGEYKYTFTVPYRLWFYFKVTEEQIQFSFDSIVGVDDYGHMMDIALISRCNDCWLAEGKFKCDCYDKDRNKIRRGDIKLNKRIRSKEGHLEWFFKNYESSCTI